MYDHRLLAVDLPTVIRVAMARNIDIKEAQQSIEASRGVYESNVGAIFPSHTPNITALGIQEALSTTSGLALATLYALLSSGRDRVGHQSGAGRLQRHCLEATT
jgi:hypothetical protein